LGNLSIFLVFLWHNDDIGQESILCLNLQRSAIGTFVEQRRQPILRSLDRHGFHQHGPSCVQQRPGAQGEKH